MPSHMPAGDDLVYLSATEALQLSARREVSPVELMRAVVARAEKVEPLINAFTGTVGFKAPYGRNPGLGMLAADHYRGDGPMARTVDDVIAFQNVPAGPDPRDHTSIRPELTLPTSYEDVAGTHIALCTRLGEYDVHPEVEAHTRAAARTLADAGAQVEEITLPWTHLDLLTVIAGHFSTILGGLVIEAAETQAPRAPVFPDGAGRSRGWTASEYDLWHVEA
ncbi:amidase family protein [Streptomyces sp. NPDC050507]|uniref:amidase family protein n=1 Tax=Streptomyces sp. NPDC050507 TaxID=3365619 RepID=UPI00378E34A9